MGRGCLSVPANRNASRKSRQPTGLPGRRSFADDHGGIEASLPESSPDRGADSPTADHDDFSVGEIRAELTGTV